MDEYDDEYDDTYDSNDVKFAGTIELSTVEDIPVGSGEEEQEEYESRDSMPSSSRPVSMAGGEGGVNGVMIIKSSLSILFSLSLSLTFLACTHRSMCRV